MANVDFEKDFGRLVLLRHGETAWSLSGQHTGRTDIPLTPHGEEQAREAGERLRKRFPEGFEARDVFVSPLQRAQVTARLAGFPTYNVTSQIAEWDYGAAEGRTRAQIARALGQEAWSPWDRGPRELPAELQGEHDEMLPDGTVVHVIDGPGESAEQAAERAAGLIQTIWPALADGRNVLCVAHAHILRILTSVWLEQPAQFGRHLDISTARFCVLGLHSGERAIIQWNV